MSTCQRITSPDDPALDQLCHRLAQQASETDLKNQWPAEQLRWCGEAGVFEWFIETAWGGQAWSSEDLVRGYLKLSAACLTTAFIITQRSSACSRIASSQNEALKERLMPRLASGELFTTVGISHLTTSRRHLSQPILTATPTAGGYELNGYSPWVTGAAFADVIVIGATVDSGNETENAEQILVALPRELTGVRAEEPAQLVGVSASHTGQLRLNHCLVSDEILIAGPVEEVLATGSGGSSGGYQTSTLALGLTSAALNFLQEEVKRRSELIEPYEAFRAEHYELVNDLLAVVGGDPICSTECIRQRSNSLVLRCTQASLAAAKGAGYLQGHPAGRWCREALFFLVWSCPQPVMNANMCELAGLD